MIFTSQRYNLPMQIGKDDIILTFEKPEEFNAWLAKHYDKVPFVWLRFYKKGSGKISINYDQALDEALCYGWIDGIAKSYDNESYVQRFTPRRPKGNWSKRNTEHIERLIREKRMKPSGMAEVEAAKKDGRWDAAYTSPANAEVPKEFIQEIAKNKKAKAYFDSLNKTSLYFIAYRLQTAKKPETLQRRKEKILEMLEKGEKFY